MLSLLPDARFTENKYVLLVLSQAEASLFSDCMNVDWAAYYPP